MPEPSHPPAAPAFLSPPARTALEMPILPSEAPAAGDWHAHIARLDASIGASLPHPTAPLDSRRTTAAGVPTYVITPPTADPEGPVYLDIHGGALVCGGGDLTRRLAEPHALDTGVVHWAVDYRMPPDHPFPAGLDDVTAVYRELLGERSAAQIVVGGDSAGGNLAAALLLRAREEGLPMPAGLVLHSPEVDLTESGDSFATLRHVSVGLQSLRAVNLLYADGADLSHPHVSPLFGDLTGFPPTLLVSGTRDLFLSNTVRMHRALREAGVAADLHVFDGRPHAGYGAAPEELAVIRELRSFTRTRLGLPPETGTAARGSAIP